MVGLMTCESLSIDLLTLISSNNFKNNYKSLNLLSNDNYTLRDIDIYLYGV